MTHRIPTRPGVNLAVWFGYLFFVVYGSLVPLDYRPIPLDQAWLTFQHIPMLRLGVESRADWIANGILYVPVGFLAAHVLRQLFPEGLRYLSYPAAALLSISLALSVEFIQIFFPPRTVSLNDLLAESIGSVVGTLLAAKYSERFKKAQHEIFRIPQNFAARLGEAYLLAYVVFSLFPYDILLSGAELEQKILGRNWGWLLAGATDDAVHIALKLFAEIVLTIPIGVFLAYRRFIPEKSYKHAVFWGFLIGFFIEFAQLFIASGVSQGLSILTRILGVLGGLVLWANQDNWALETLRLRARNFVLPLSVCYFGVLLQVNGWLSRDWNGTDYALTQLQELHFLPFYYHYFTTEAKALASLVVVCFTYLPIGLMTWIGGGTPVRSVFHAILASALVETGKLFLSGMHPDPTNILLAGFASWVGFHLVNTLVTVGGMPTAFKAAPEQPTQSPSDGWLENRSVTNHSSRRWMNYALLVPVAALVSYQAATFPTSSWLLCSLLAASAVAIWRNPLLIAGILPAALPILDLAPWSGRFYWDEFDLLILVSLAVAFARLPATTRRQRKTDVLFSLVAGLLIVSIAISTMRGLFPWRYPDINSFTNYYSPYNALRIAKGAFWAILFIALLRRLDASSTSIRRTLAWGLVAGLTLTVAVIFWERVAFSGLFNFNSDYRITGPFSAMHTGGAYIECFLTVAAPFLIILLFQLHSWVLRSLGMALLLGTTYALMVTFSRNGYAAFMVAVAIVVFFAVFKFGLWRQRVIIATVFLGAFLAVAVPVFKGQFAQDRMATVWRDLNVRQVHWEDAIGMHAPDVATSMFGMGVGRYPESHYLLSRSESRSGTYQFKQEDGNTFLQLVSGSSIYIEQLVPVEPGQTYRLKFDVRANMPDASLTVPICEKWLLSSFNCMWNSKNVGNNVGTWRHFELLLRSDQLLASPWYSRRPIKLSLYNGNAKAVVDVDNVILENSKGEDLVRNGNFSEDFDHWFFSADSHLQWHAKNLLVSVFFDQGWFGLLAICAFSLFVIQRAFVRARNDDLQAAAFLAAFVGFLVVGVFDTLIDTPRFLFLFLLLGWFGGVKSQQKRSASI